MFDAGVSAARRRMRPAGVDPDYDLAYRHFDLRHFLLQARHFLTEPRDPLERFLLNGAGAKASPEINFDMRAYLARHPERRNGRDRSPYLAWLKTGRDAGEIADPAPGLELVAPVLGRSPTEVAVLLAELRSDLQQRLLTGELGEMLAKAAEVEPLIADTWPETATPKVPPFYGPTTSAQVAAVHAAQSAAGFRPARVVMVISDPRWGGGRRAEGHIAHSIARHLDPDEVVVVYTDRGGRAPEGRFPAGVREIDLVPHLEGVDQEAGARVLLELIRSFRPEVVLNVNSMLLYATLTTYGRALAASQRIVLVMFGNEQLALGNWVGIPLRYFYRCIDLVDAVVTDSDFLRSWLVERHQLPPGTQGRMHVFPAPVDPGLDLAPATERRPGARPQVFWAGRLDRQKRVDLAFAVARRMPDVDFRMWGERVLNAPLLEQPPANVHLLGPYGHISELDLSTADAWLYTSGWDGVPSQLLEVAMTGVPLVASEVGGVSEILSPVDAWPVPDHDDADAYVAALRDVLADPSRSRRRAVALRERLVRERTEHAYDRHVGSVVLRLDEPVGAASEPEEALP